MSLPCVITLKKKKSPCHITYRIHTHTHTHTHTYVVPKLFIMYFITWIFNFFRKEGTVEEKKKQTPQCVHGFVLWWQVLHTYIIIVRSHSDWGTSLQHILGSFHMPGEIKTHWIFVRPMMSLCVKMHWDCPLFFFLFFICWLSFKKRYY